MRWLLWLTVAFVFVITGLFQLSASAAALELFGWPEWLALTSTMLGLGWVPPIGNILGVCGAIRVWNWPLSTSLGIFFAPQMIVLLLLVLKVMARKGRRRRQ